MGFPKGPKFRPPSPNFDSFKKSLTRAVLDGQGDAAHAAIQENLDGVYRQAEASGVVDPSDGSVANFTPAYVAPEPITALGATPSRASISRASPLELSRAINGDEIAAANERLFLRNNSPDQATPFPIIHPKGLRAHLDSPVYFLRGLADDIDFPDAYGKADTASGYAMWDKMNEGTRRTTDKHEALHLMNDRGFPSLGDDFVPWEINPATGEPTPSGQPRQMERFARAYENALDRGMNPHVADEIAGEGFDIYDRMADPRDPNRYEARALMAEALGDIQGIHGPAATNADRMELWRLLLGNGQAPLTLPDPVYKYGPQQGRPATRFNDLQRGIRSLNDSLPKDGRETLREIWLKLFSDNSETPEAPYA